ncbi:MAG: PepSY domain-containing protein [Bacteroidaceae bacterium]|nr:PepSY domain-containing protein [Bacteroidaceae bacterium]
MNSVMKKIHLWMALPFGIIISVICFTGALLVVEKPITRWLYPDFYADVRSSQVSTFEAGNKVVHSAPVDAPKTVAKAKRKRLPFFRDVMRLHRWLLNAPSQKGEKSVGKIIVGVSTIAFALTLISGLFIWWPRNAKVLRNRLSVKFRKGWRRFLLDAHVSLGFWVFVFLLLMALTGLTWSFQSYRDVFYSLLSCCGTREEVRRLVMSLHTGSWGGVFSQTIYFISAIIGATLPLTGYYLWWKRIRNNKVRGK